MNKVMQEKLVDTNMAKKLNLLKKLVRLQVDKTLKESQLTEVSANALKSKYDKALKKEQQLSSLMLINLEKYKKAKASGDEKAIAKYTKIAGQLSPKKRKATKDASAAYQAYEDKISGLHSDAELEIDEAASTDPALKSLRTRTPGQTFPELDKWWEYEPEDIMTYVYWHQGQLPPTGPKFEKEWKNIVKQLHLKYPIPADAEGHLDMDNIGEGKLTEALARGLKPLLMIGSKVKWTTMSEDALVDLSDKFEEIDDEDADNIASHLNMSIELRQDGYRGDATKKLKQFNKACADALRGKPVKSAFEGKLSEALAVDGDGNYKYKKYVTKAFHKIHDAMFEFRHAMGVKQIGQDDPKLKKQLDALHTAVVNFQNELKSKGLTGGLTEGKLNEMDLNDPILVAIRARQTALKKKAALPKVKKISTKQYYKLMDMESDIIDQMKAAAKEYETLDSEMNQDAGQKGSNWTDADANRYGGDLNKLQTKIEKLAKEKLKVKKAIMSYRIN